MKYQKAAFKATLLLISCWLFAMVPVLNILMLMVVMLPLAVLDGLGVTGLGTKSSGFFIPNELGYGLLSFGGWLIFFSFFAGTFKRSDE